MPTEPASTEIDVQQEEIVPEAWRPPVVHARQSGIDPIALPSEQTTGKWVILEPVEFQTPRISRSVDFQLAESSRA